MLEKIEITKEIKEILEILHANGQGYVVGGYVRDKLLGLEPTDCDFVTDIPYERLEEIFKDYSPKEIGKHFGVMQIIYKGKDYEIAKMRQDIGIPENRKLQAIEYTSDIYEDLKRRDFTVNAIAFDGENYFCDEQSVEDIRRKNLRFIGNPTQRMKEDPVRILRAFRFLASKELNLCFSLHEVKENVDLLDGVAIERIRDEFNRFIVEKDLTVFRLMSGIGIISKIVPEWESTIGFDQRSKGHDLTVDEHIIKAMESAQPDFILRLALFFHDIGKPASFTIDEDGKGHFHSHEVVSAEMTKSIMKRMKYDKKTIERVYRLVKTHFFYRSQVGEVFVKKLLNYLGEEDIYRFYKIVEADKIAHRPPYDFTSIDRMKIMHYNIIDRNIPYRLQDLKVTGKDIVEKVGAKGKTIGEILDYLLEIVIVNPKKNDYEYLMSVATEFKNQIECIKCNK